MKIYFLIFFLTLLNSSLGCRREPSIYHAKTNKLPGDNGIQIKISENPSKYVPGKVYTMMLMASNPLDRNQRFTKFILNAESINETGNISPQKVGSFQLFRDSLATFNQECVNTISETNQSLKTDVFFMWVAPPPGSGCVSFKAMVLKDPYHWYAEEGNLVKTICELTDEDKFADPNECCACDEASYSLIFEGLWSNITHPKDFPTLLWLTHFSDVIGASHERNFTFWGEGQIASEGFRSLAEWGSIRLMETELRAKSRYLRSIIKAAGLWYPNVNLNTTTKFKVDRKHPMVSLASMFGPTPDWVVGVNGLNLCLKNCTWRENQVIDLFPYDAGTDNGITYMSPNSETNPREKMYRITTTYPEDPRAPFYDPTKKEIEPLARLYLTRVKLIPKNCDDNFLNAQLEISDNTEDTSRAECAVTEYSNWSKCSVSCGKGLRMRSRQYILAQKAAMFNCNRQLVSKEMCVADIAECPKTEKSNDDLLDEIPLPEDNTGVCTTAPWGAWSECSVTCGIGFKMRTRFFVDKMGMKKCPHITTVEKAKCMMPLCLHSSPEPKDPMCPTTDWSFWSPCSASCGKGVKVKTRFLLVEGPLVDKCTQRIELRKEEACSEVPNCLFDMQTAKEVCMLEKDAGLCGGNFKQWYFESKKMTCLPFNYTGCRGNRNNFDTAEDCEKSCGILRDISRNQQVSSTTNPLNNKIDCLVSQFSDWSPCSATCGHGITESVRRITRYPQNGGKACPNRLIKRRKCVGSPCPRNIVY